MMTASAETGRPSRSRTPRMMRGASLVVGGLSLVGSRWSLAVASPSSPEPTIDQRPLCCERQTTIDHRLDHHFRHFRLLDLQIRLRLQHFAHLEAVGLLV